MDPLSALEFVGKVLLGLGAGLLFMLIAGFVSAWLGDSFCKSYHPDGDSLLKRIFIFLLILILVGLSLVSIPFSLSWAGVTKGVYWGGTVISVIIIGVLNLIICLFMGTSAAEPDQLGDDN